MESGVEWIPKWIKEWIVATEECFEEIERIPRMEWKMSGIGGGVAGPASSAPSPA